MLFFCLSNKNLLDENISQNRRRPLKQVPLPSWSNGKSLKGERVSMVLILVSVMASMEPSNRRSLTLLLELHRKEEGIELM
jgi:hypothetical protein